MESKDQHQGADVQSDRKSAYMDRFFQVVVGSALSKSPLSALLKEIEALVMSNCAEIINTADTPVDALPVNSQAVLLEVTLRRLIDMHDAGKRMAEFPVAHDYDCAAVGEFERYLAEHPDRGYPKCQGGWDDARQEWLESIVGTSAPYNDLTEAERWHRLNNVTQPSPEQRVKDNIEQLISDKANVDPADVVKSILDFLTNADQGDLASKVETEANRIPGSPPRRGVIHDAPEIDGPVWDYLIGIFKQHRERYGNDDFALGMCVQDWDELIDERGKLVGRVIDLEHHVTLLHATLKESAGVFKDILGLNQITVDDPAVMDAIFKRMTTAMPAIAHVLTVTGK